MSKSDPAAFIREIIGQWENVSTLFGQDGKAGEATGATRAKGAAQDMISRALAAGNMPSRDEMLELIERVRSVEDRLGRIETLLIRLASEVPQPSRAETKPARAKKHSKQS